MDKTEDVIIRCLRMQVEGQKNLRYIAETRAENYRREYLKLLSELDTLRREVESATVAENEP